MTLSEYVSQERGIQAALARALNISPALISQWSTGDRVVPAERCLSIEKATNGAVTRYELRPDVFGQSPQAA